MTCVRVLVVEDDPVILLTTAETLRASGFDVVEAETADGALDVLEHDYGGFLALFSDIETPGKLNGLELAATVVERWPSIPIVLTSGRVFPGPDVLPHEVRFVGKPYNLDAVAELLHGLAKM